MTSVQVQRLYKIFGPRPAEMVRRLDRGAGAEEIREAGGTAAVVNASFAVSEGETFVVMGLSGSGKSTLIRMLNGLVAPSSGKVYVDDEDVTAMSASTVRAMRQRTMSMVFQHFALFPHRTVLDNAGYGLLIQGIGRDERVDGAREALAMVGLEGWEDRYPQQLSGGMRQRVGLARALAARTDLLLMDEAFSALDPLIKREMQDQLLSLNARLGKTIVFITHDLNEAMRLGDRIAVMGGGEIVQIGTSEQILNQPADDYVAKFVQDVDRSRVLTAASIAEPLDTRLDPDSSAEEALEVMRREASDRLFVVDGQRRLLGVLSVSAAEQARRQSGSTVRAALADADPAVAGSDLANSLFERMGKHPAPLPVVDRQRKLLGVITPSRLLEALSQQNSSTATEAGDNDV